MEIYGKGCDTPDRVGRRLDSVLQGTRRIGPQSVTRDRTTE